MPLLDRWRRWRNTPVPMRRLLLEAALELACARLLVAISLRRSLPELLRPASPAEPAPPDALQRDIRCIMALAARSVPWRSVCLPNALAAKRMLSRRGYGSTLHLGVGRRAAGDTHAHAWLEAGGRIITGEDGIAAVTPLPHPPQTGPSQAQPHRA